MFALPATAAALSPWPAPNTDPGATNQGAFAGPTDPGLLWHLDLDDGEVLWEIGNLSPTARTAAGRRERRSASPQPHTTQAALRALPGARSCRSRLTADVPDATRRGLTLDRAAHVP